MKIEISESLFKRLEKLAKPFIDTPESVIERAVSNLEKAELITELKPLRTNRVYRGYDELPSVKHTKPRSITVDDIVHADNTWSGINHWLHTRAAALVGVDEILLISKANIKKGVKEDNGFDYVPKIGCSIQRSDAATTLRQICHLAQAMDFNISLLFEWKDHEEATFPGQSASLELTPHSRGISK